MPYGKPATRHQKPPIRARWVAEHADPALLAPALLASSEVRRFRFEGGGEDGRSAPDLLAVEEPLELRVDTGADAVTLAVLMRTPGADLHLVRGWLWAEGLWSPELGLSPDTENANVVHLHSPQPERLLAGARRGVSSSACGVCGTGQIEALSVQAAAPVWTGGPLDPRWLAGLPQSLQAAQPGFAASGGLHAAGLVTPQGEWLCAFEDVGRHNATDKAVGWALEAGGLPLSEAVLVVSSRAGFEIVQKAVLAGIAVVVAVGAATSLAVDTAATFGLTLCGWARPGRLTVYSGAERLRMEP